MASIVISFGLSLLIAMISVVAGIGGGIIFTPLMLAFTSIDSLTIRATGIIVAMFSGLVSTGFFIKQRTCNYKLCVLLALSQSIGCIVGAKGAFAFANSNVTYHEEIIRLLLGIILIALTIYFILKKNNVYYPNTDKMSKFDKYMNLGSSYLEESDGTFRTYNVKNIPLGIIIVFFIGILGGFFGMGGGWAITPTLNLGMGLPLKIASINSGTILGIANCVTIWEYINNGSVIPQFVMPWLAGQVIGGYFGSKILRKIKIDSVRKIMISIMSFTALTLLFKSLSNMNVIPKVSNKVQVILFVALIAAALVSICTCRRNNARKNISWYNYHLNKKHILYGDLMLKGSMVVGILSIILPIVYLFNNNVLPLLYIVLFVGCSIHGWASIPETILQIKRKEYKYAIMNIAFIFIMILTMLNVV